MPPSSLSMLRTWPEMESGEYLVSVVFPKKDDKHEHNTGMNSSQWDDGRRAPLAHDRRADGGGGGLDEAEAPHSHHHRPGGRLRSQVSPEVGKAQVGERRE